MNYYLTKPENIRYHTGFIGTFGIALLIGKSKYLITDGRYQIQAQKLCTKETKIIIIYESLSESVDKVFRKHKVKECGFEANHLSYYQALSLRRKHKQIKFTPVDKQIDQLRMIKTAAELKLIQKSQELNEQTLKKVLKLLKPGVSEAEIAWQIYKIGRDLGADDTSFDPIIAFGPNSASPHYTPSHKTKLKKGQSILIDMGLKYQGYCSDMTRCFFTKTPSSQQAEVYNTVLEAQINAINNIQPGQKGSKGDHFSRSVIKEAGYGDYFTHANGHGVGLEIHEAPSLSSKTKHKDRRLEFAKDMVVTVEPGIYLPGKFGIRIEDMIVVKEGKNHNLTQFPKEIAKTII